MVISSVTSTTESVPVIVADDNMAGSNAMLSSSPPAGAIVYEDESEEVFGDLVDPNVNALVERLEQLDRAFIRVPVTPDTRIRVDADHLSIGDDNLSLNQLGWERLAKQYGAPSSYWSQFEPDFRAEIANYHFDHDPKLSGGRPDAGLEAVAFENRFLGFRPSQLTHLEFTMVMQAVMRGLGPDGRHFTVNRVRITDESIRVELKTSHRMKAVEVDDIVEGGIAFSHSFLGTTPTNVELFVFRLICSNGLALRHCIAHASISRSRRLKNRDNNSVADAMSQIERLTHERMSHLDSLLESLGQLPASRIESSAGSDDEESMRRFLMPTLRATHLWSNDLWLRVIAPAWRHAHGGNGELHEFAAVNTITYVATHQQDLSFRQRQTLARLGGLLAFQRVHVCPRCHNAVVGN